MHGGQRLRHLTCPTEPADLSAHNRCRTTATSILPPGRRRNDRPDASRGLLDEIASGPQRGPPANAIPAPESESSQTPINPGTAGERVKSAEVRVVSRQVWDAPRIRQRIDRGRERKWSELNLIWAICAAWLFGMNCRTRNAYEIFQRDASDDRPDTAGTFRAGGKRARREHGRRTGGQS